MKSLTDIKQSKNLMEILSPESADFIMYYNKEDRSYVITDYHDDAMSGKDDIPCWSLAALIDIIPKNIFDGEYIINITEGCDEKWVITYDHIDNKSHSFYGLSSGASNLVDACYEIILKLNERKML